jgi:hypothetical protein
VEQGRDAHAGQHTLSAQAFAGFGDCVMVVDR